jgi:plasmid stability protein
MAAVSIRDLEDWVRERLRLRAAGNGRSMEAEMRAILTAAVQEEPEEGLFDVLIDRFAAVGGVELEIPERATHTRAAQIPS